jgi:hypothetical protein
MADDQGKLSKNDPKKSDKSGRIGGHQSQRVTEKNAGDDEMTHGSASRQRDSRKQSQRAS